ncbi:MAG: Mur ligase family protein, partial [Candidatus Solibacter sp.]|nr:Mur ligase family protein [Candidatus Solibacter sp.]
DEFAAAFSEVHSTAERLLARCAIDMHPTYFETVTAMAFLLFRERGADTVVLETGMGGRLDATNVVDPVLSVITPIDFDHEKFLGTTIPQIAYEKAGIMKSGRPVVVARQHADAARVIASEARLRGCRLIRAADWRVDHLAVNPYGSRFRAIGPQASVQVECPLIGAHQVENSLTAIAALSELGLTPDQIGAGIAATTWPGRLERVASAPDIFLDGAHNPAGARALSGYIRRFHHQRRKIWLVFGAMRDKDLHAIAPLLFPLAAELIFTTPNQTRAFRTEEIRDLTAETRACLAPSVPEAGALARQAAPGDVVFITGSLYLVGEARALLVA